MSTPTARLDSKLERQLKRLARQTWRSKRELVRQMLRKQLALDIVEQLPIASPRQMFVMLLGIT